MRPLNNEWLSNAFTLCYWVIKTYSRVYKVLKVQFIQQVFSEGLLCSDTRPGNTKKVSGLGIQKAKFGKVFDF